MQRKAVSEATRFRVLSRDNFTCQYCGGTAPKCKLEVDHIIPVSKGGTNELDNLITSCHECNHGKSDGAGIKEEELTFNFNTKNFCEVKEQVEIIPCEYGFTIKCNETNKEIRSYRLNLIMEPSLHRNTKIYAKENGFKSVNDLICQVLSSLIKADMKERPNLYKTGDK